MTGVSTQEFQDLFSPDFDWLTRVFFFLFGTLANRQAIGDWSIPPGAETVQRLTRMLGDPISSSFTVNGSTHDTATLSYAPEVSGQALSQTKITSSRGITSSLADSEYSSEVHN